MPTKFPPHSSNKLCSRSGSGPESVGVKLPFSAWRDILCCHVPVAISFHSAIPLFWALSETHFLDRCSGRCVHVAREACWPHSDRHGSGESSEKPSTTRLNCDFVISGLYLQRIKPGTTATDKQKSPFQGGPNLQGLNIRFLSPCNCILRCVLSPSNSQMSGKDVQTEVLLPQVGS